MALSTGFDETRVLAALAGRLGWRDSTLDGMPAIDTANKASASGRYYNDGSFHASCTIQHLYDSQEDSEVSDTEFNTFLSNLEKSIILSALNVVFDKTSVIESGLLFQRTFTPSGFTPRYEPNGNYFVGVRVQPAVGDFAVSLDSITVLLDSAKTFNLYIFKDFLNSPIETISVTTVANQETTVSVGKVLNHLSSENKGGAYFIGYFQTDLGDAKAIDCDPHMNCFKVFGVDSIKSPISGAGFDKFNYSSSSDTYGLNFEFSSYYDYTDKIVKAAHQFDEYLGLCMAAKVIEHVLSTQRSNGTERTGAINLQALNEDLNAPEYTQGLPISAGLKARLQREIKRLKAIFHQQAKNKTVSIC